MPNIANDHFSSRAKARHQEAERALAADKDRYIEIWKKAVETQMHFNEMSVKSRQLGLTFVAAALGVAVVTLSRNEDFSQQFSFFGLPLVIHVALLLNIAAYLALWAVKELDLNVYHKMLRGAVTFGEDFENNYLKSIFDLEKGMTQAISHYSRSMKADVDKSGKKYRYVEEKGTSAEAKINRFYSLTLGFLLISAGAFFLMTNLPVWLSSSEPAQERTQNLSVAPSLDVIPTTASGNPGDMAPPQASEPNTTSPSPPTKQ